MKKERFKGGATRSATKIRMDLVPACGLLRIGARFGLGAELHGEQNWKGGGEDFIKATINHLEQHTQKLKEGKVVDDHLGAIGWAAVALCWFEENKPEEFKKALKALA